MTPRARLLAVVGAVVVAAYVGYRLFVHSSSLLTPAVITPRMNAHRALSPSLDARVDRLLHEHPAHDRSDSARLIALTFDDGPYAVGTPLLLDVLHQYGVTATFFLIGRDVEIEPELTRRIVAGGYEVADHTLTHPNLDQLSQADVAKEILGGKHVLEAYTHAHTISDEMRPPHGRFTEATIRTAQRLGYTVVLWTDDPGDWRNVSAANLAQHVLRHASAPDILLLHSGRLATVAMLHTIIPRFQAAGFRFVTVSELLKAQSPLQVNHPEKLGFGP